VEGVDEKRPRRRRRRRRQRRRPSGETAQSGSQTPSTQEDSGHPNERKTDAD
jgi:hypothetical protein